jgi:alpha-beta hydrolase superfamily lysophospholipase
MIAGDGAVGAAGSGGSLGGRRRPSGMAAVTAVVSGLLWSGAFCAARAQDQPRTQAQARLYEKADRMPASSFYDTPSPLPPGAPGRLIRSQAVAGYALPKGVRAVRILYHSRSATGQDVAASGVVLLPVGPVPKGSWPVIAWAHGTSGVARICAPSMMKDVYYGTEGLVPMLQAGFAVVAVDYAGLGTDVPHQYMSLDAQAGDVINGIKAAHAAVTDLSPRWVVDGHSQGGAAAWLVAQQEAVLRDPGFQGAVSVAGAMNVPWLIHYLAVSGSDSFYAVFLAYGIKARFPQFNVADMLSRSALAQYPAMTTQGCWYYGYATELSHLLGKTAIRPGFADNRWVRKFAAQDFAFRHRPTRPLLVLAGGADQSVPPQSIRQVAAKACRLGYPLQFRVFPGLDHDPLMDKSTPYQLRWIRARFAGKPASGNCAALSGH